MPYTWLSFNILYVNCTTNHPACQTLSLRVILTNSHKINHHTLPFFTIFQICPPCSIWELKSPLSPSFTWTTVISSSLLSLTLKSASNPLPEWPRCAVASLGFCQQWGRIWTSNTVYRPAVIWPLKDTFCYPLLDILSSSHIDPLTDSEYAALIFTPRLYSCPLLLGLPSAPLPHFLWLPGSKNLVRDPLLSLSMLPSTWHISIISTIHWHSLFLQPNYKSLRAKSVLLFLWILSA